MAAHGRIGGLAKAALLAVAVTGMIFGRMASTTDVAHASAPDYGSRIVSCPTSYSPWGAVSAPVRATALNLTSGVDQQQIWSRAYLSDGKTVYTGNWLHTSIYVREGNGTSKGVWLNDNGIMADSVITVGARGTYQANIELWWKTPAGKWYGPVYAALPSPSTCRV
jgi:hypothetical protein